VPELDETRFERIITEDIFSKSGRNHITNVILCSTYLGDTQVLTWGSQNILNVVSTATCHPLLVPSKQTHELHGLVAHCTTERTKASWANCSKFIARRCLSP